MVLAPLGEEALYEHVMKGMGDEVRETLVVVEHRAVTNVVTGRRSMVGAPISVGPVVPPLQPPPPPKKTSLAPRPSGLSVMMVAWCIVKGEFGKMSRNRGKALSC